MFAIIAINMIVISQIIAGIAYFAAKMPNSKKLLKVYHFVSWYPFSNGVLLDAIHTPFIFAHP